MQKWQYTVQSFVIGDPEDELQTVNRLGAEGWEAYAVVTGMSALGNVTNYFFKRPLHSRGSETPKAPRPQFGMGLD